jgi:hypothetical protein
MKEIGYNEIVGSCEFGEGILQIVGKLSNGTQNSLDFISPVD